MTDTSASKEKKNTATAATFLYISGGFLLQPFDFSLPDGEFSFKLNALS
jgi:hypothetical protein